MKKKDIYGFFKSKLKERGIKVNDFNKMCDVSKATLYRIMKGLQKPTLIQQERIIELLEFDDVEKDTFFQCIKQLEFDESQLEAFRVLKSVIFKSDFKVRAEPLEFIVYSTGKTIKTYDEILETIYANSTNEDFYCDIKIFSCTEDKFIDPIEQLLVVLKEADIKVEHLITFYEDGALENANSFKTMIKLLRYSKYYVLAREVESVKIPALLSNLGNNNVVFRCSFLLHSQSVPEV